MTKLANKFEPISLQHNQISSFNDIMFAYLTINPSDSQETLSNKLNALMSFRSFLEEFVQFEKLGSREAKLAYMDFADNLNQHIERLQLLTGQRTLESIERAGKRFAKKTQFPVGIIE